MSSIPDPKECADLDCSIIFVIDICPNKCTCENKPTCPPCYNSGKLDLKTCACTCNKDYTGERCQYALDPCSVDDDEFCSSINCWTATSDMFFKCQRKCLCCENKQCFNLGEY